MPDTPQMINWPKAALTLEQSLEKDVIESSVLEHLHRAEHVLVACSGGADSVFLLCLLVARAQEIGLQLHVAHYNHRWRREESDADANYVESLLSLIHI